VFNADGVPYDGVDLVIGQQPLTIVYMKSQIHWTQQAAGTIDFGTRTFGLESSNPCYTGGSIISDWPKPGAKLDGGYSVSAASAIGNGAQYGQPCQHHFAYQNVELKHLTGDVMSENASWTTVSVWWRRSSLQQEHASRRS